MGEQAGYSLTKSQLHRAERYRAAGIPWSVIAASVGASERAIRCGIDPGFREKRRESDRRQQANFVSPAPELHASENRLPPSVIAKVIATVPADTRNFTARLCGDPLTGRSALDKRHSNTGAVD